MSLENMNEVKDAIQNASMIECKVLEDKWPSLNLNSFPHSKGIPFEGLVYFPHSRGIP